MEHVAFTPLVYYVDEDEEKVRSRIEVGISINAVNSYYENGILSQETALMNAVSDDNTKVAELLLEQGADIHLLNEGALRLAILFENVGMVKFLIEKGADINVKHEGDTLLHYSVECGSLEVLKYLIKCGMDIRALNDEKETPLDIAIKKYKKVIEEFLRGLYLEKFKGHILQK
jgi:ankyrin repeat protein